MVGWLPNYTGDARDARDARLETTLRDTGNDAVLGFLLNICAEPGA